METNCENCDRILLVRKTLEIMQEYRRMAFAKLMTKLVFPGNGNPGCNISNWPSGTWAATLPVRTAPRAVRMYHG